MAQLSIQKFLLVSFVGIALCAVWRLLPDISPVTLTVALIVLSNIKALPFIWHLRVFAGFFLASTSFSTIAHEPLRLFAPHISTSHTPLLEIDYNLHKSNSTYFSDLDISRSRLLLSLFRTALSDLTHDHNAPCNIVLGGAACNFRKAIPPLGRYRMVSCVLCWDRKWLYVATQFRAIEEDEREGEESAKGSGTVYATALAQYVVKAGRVTVPPEKLIEAAGLCSTKGSREWKEAENRSERALRYVQGFVAMDELHREFAVLK